ESAMLAAAGGAAAIFVSYVGNRLLTAAIPPGGLPYWITLTMDGRVAAVLVAVCLSTVLLFGLAPAIQLARTSANAVIKDTSLSVSHDRGAAWWTWCVALSLRCARAGRVALTHRLDNGVMLSRAPRARGRAVAARHILTFGIVLPADVSGGAARSQAFYEGLSGRLVAPDRAVAF